MAIVKPSMSTTMVKILMAILTLFVITLLIPFDISIAYTPIKKERYLLGNTNYTIQSIADSNRDKMNILIGMAINCKYNITKNTKRLIYDKTKINVYWKFNIYDHQKCENNHTIINNANIRIIKQSIRKIIFWVDHFKPDHLFFNQTIDYLWLIDDDLMLETFNFNEFINLASNPIFQHSILQPSIMSKCASCPGSYWDILNHDYYKSSKQKPHNFGIIGFDSHIVEIMAPLFRFKIWKLLHPYIYQQFKVIGNDLPLPDWGLDRWWCGAVRHLLNGSCVVLDYTPLIHLNTKTYPKPADFRKQGYELQKRLKNHDGMLGKFWSISEKIKLKYEKGKERKKYYYIDTLYAMENKTNYQGYFE